VKKAGGSTESYSTLKEQKEQNEQQQKEKGVTKRASQRKHKKRSKE